MQQKASGCFDRIVVSTDDLEIAEVARQLGAEVPFMRPAELSGDYIGAIPVVRHALQWLIENGDPVHFACCIYATAPFLSTLNLQRGWELVSESKYDYAFSVTTYAFPIQRAFRITEKGGVGMFNPECFSVRSQDLEEAWHDAGQFYWGTVDAWLQEKASLCRIFSSCEASTSSSAGYRHSRRFDTC